MLALSLGHRGGTAGPPTARSGHVRGSLRSCWRPWALARTTRLRIAGVERVVICRRRIALVVLAVLWGVTAAAPAAAAQPPANDAFSAGATIRGEEGESETTNAGATKESGEPAHAGNAGGASVWFRWTAPRDGHFAFDTAASDFDTVLAVYMGQALGALDQLAADDDSGSEERSEISFRASAGTLYHVAVDGFHGKVGRVRLAWRPAPPNDNFADARTLDRTGSAAISSFGATAEMGEPDHSEGSEADQSIWFRWTAPADTRVGFIPSGGSAVAYTGTSLTTLQPLAEESAIFDAVAGTTYHIAVEGAEGDTVLSWRTGAPANDNFAEALRIVGRSGRVRGSNLLASREKREPEHISSEGSVWYRWRAPRTGVVRLRTTGITFDTILAVYRGSRLRSLRQLAIDDDSGRGVASKIILEVQRGRVYRIAVTGFSMGKFTLRWRLARPEG
jgi:hypothetical protein